MKRSFISALGLVCGMLAGLSAPALAAADAAFGQPADERRAQQALPKSQAALWAVLRKTKIGEDDKRGVFTASFPDEVKALDGQSVALSGFMMPLDTTAKSKHFLLTKYTPVCFFCPPGQPNEVVEVTTNKGVAITARMLTVNGRMALINNAEKGLFFRLDGASTQ
jgi:hypothetical protein